MDQSRGHHWAWILSIGPSTKIFPSSSQSLHPYHPDLTCRRSWRRLWRQTRRLNTSLMMISRRWCTLGTRRASSSVALSRNQMIRGVGEIKTLGPQLIAPSIRVNQSSAQSQWKWDTQVRIKRSSRATSWWIILTNSMRPLHRWLYTRVWAVLVTQSTQSRLKACMIRYRRTITACISIRVSTWSCNLVAVLESKIVVQSSNCPMFMFNRCNWINPHACRSTINSPRMMWLAW